MGTAGFLYRNKHAYPRSSRAYAIGTTYLQRGGASSDPSYCARMFYKCDLWRERADQLKESEEMQDKREALRDRLFDPMGVGRYMEEFGWLCE